MATANTRVSLTVDVHTNLRRSPVPSCSPPQHQQLLEQDLGVVRNAAGSCSEGKHVPHSPKSDSQQAKDGNKKKRVSLLGISGCVCHVSGSPGLGAPATAKPLGFRVDGLATLSFLTGSHFLAPPMGRKLLGCTGQL